MIIPSDLAYNKREFIALLQKISPLSKEVHLDIMDGRFVDTKSVDVEEIPSLKKHGNLFEAHLMVKEPVPLVLPLKKRGVTRIIFHYESMFHEDIPLAVEFMRKQGMIPILAVNPETPIEDILPFAKLVDGILIMGVHPGRNHAPYIKDTPKKVAELRKHLPDVEIQVDGGMTPETIPAIVKAGANRIISGSYVGSAKNPEQAINELREASKI